MLKSNQTLNSVYEQFIDDAEIKNLSIRTIKYYEYCFKWLTKTIQKNKLIDEITKNDIKNHIRFLMKSNKATSVNTHLRGIRVIMNYMNENYGTNIKVKLIHADKKAKPTYSDSELQALLKKPSDTGSYSTYRDWVMTNVFMATGCRLGSCIATKVKDVDFESNTIYFEKMKNRKSILLPMNRNLRNILKEYIDIYKLQPYDYLFSTIKGTPFTDTGFCRTYRDYAAKRGVNNAGIHKFRHTYAKNFILAGGNPAKLQRILGHSSIDITMQYVNLYSVDLKDDVENYCYLNKIYQNK